MRFPVVPFTLFVACLAGLASSRLHAAGLENGEVVANAVSSTDGSTSSAGEVLSMEAIAPDPTIIPPLPPSFAPARATLEATMSTINLETSASIVNEHNHLASLANSLVDFVDALAVTAEGIETGRELIATVAWQVSGDVSINGPGSIQKRSKIQLEAAGVDLDPDPNAPPPPKQQWTRDISTFLPEVLDDVGVASFEYLVKAGIREPGNIRLRTAAGILVGGPGSIFSGNYDSSASSELSVAFFGVTSVRTTAGQILYRWTTSAESGLDYGARDDDPPEVPEITVAPSDGGPSFEKLSWLSKADKYYILEATEDNQNWSPLTEVLGSGQLLSIDLVRNPDVLEYRLVVMDGDGSPDPTLEVPELRILRAENSVIVTWMTNHWEIYQLSQVMPDGTLSPLHAPIGDGGAAWFEFPVTAPARLFQVMAIQN